MPAGVRARVVALAMRPSLESLAALEREWERGNAVLAAPPAAGAAESSRLRAALQPELPLEEEAVAAGVALLIATSGSTGAPKLVQLSRAALSASAQATMRRIGSDPSDHWLSCLPWHHIAGLQVALRARQTGAPLTVLDRADPHAVAGAGDATLVSLVPTQLHRLLDAAVDLTRFRAILLGGAAPAPSLLDRARAAGARVVTTYGMSETCGGCVYDGRPLDGVQVAVDGADGRIRLRGPMLMTGYRLRPELTAACLADGWFRTEDAGSLDGDRLRVHGRLDDIIVTGGEKVVAAEVAHALVEHPSLRDAAVTSVVDGEWGQRVVAVVVPHDVLPPLAELRRWVALRVTAAAAPRDVIAVPSIPRLANGKLDRLAVAALAQAAGNRSVRPHSAR